MVPRARLDWPEFGGFNAETAALMNCNQAYKADNEAYNSLYAQLNHTPTAAGAAITLALRQVCWRLGVSEAELKLMDEELPLNDADLLDMLPTPPQWRSGDCGTSTH